MKKKILFSLLSILLPLSFWAQEAHWQCDPAAFEYDMTAYVSVELDDATITDLSNYEIAAFCGKECRGVATIMTAGDKQIGYLRIRSNSASGEIITFKVYDKTEDEEIRVQNTKITFQSNATQGMPSSPFKLDITQRYTLGDVNGDGEITAYDITRVVSYILTGDETNFIFAAADMNGDGEVTVFDITQIVSIILKNE